MNIGDKVLVMPSLGENMAVPLGDVEVGDSVILYSLKNETRIAVPTLAFSIGSYAFNTPAFNFSGFNFNLDFNFQLIALNLGEITPAMYHDFSCLVVEQATTYYGDGSDCHVQRLNYGYKYSGIMTFVFIDQCDGTHDSMIEVGVSGSQLEIWAYPIPGFAFHHKLYYKTTLLTEGTSSTMPEYHGYFDL